MPPEPTATTIAAEPGQSKQHFALDVKFPVYAIDFVGDRIVLLAGGGGSSRTGVKNRIVSPSPLPVVAVSVPWNELASSERAQLVARRGLALQAASSQIVTLGGWIQGPLEAGGGPRLMSRN